MRKAGLILLVVIAAGVAINTFSSAQAQTCGATGILKIKPGGRAVGMGQAGVALHQDALSMWWNPAHLAQPRGLQAGGALVKLVPDLADDVWYMHGAGSLALGDNLGVGLSLMYLSYGKTEELANDGTSAGFFSSYELVPSAGIGARVMGSPDWGPGPVLEPLASVDVGAALKFVYVDLAPQWAMEMVGVSRELRASALAADFGCLLQGGTAFAEDGQLIWSLGANAQNLSFQDLELGDPEPLPRNLKAGVGLDVRVGRAELFTDQVEVLRCRLAFDINKTLIDYDSGGLKPTWGLRGPRALLNGGCDLTFLDTLSLRLGHIYDPDGEIEAVTRGPRVWLPALGLRITFESISLYADYASVPQALDLDRVHYFSGGIALL